MDKLQLACTTMYGQRDYIPNYIVKLATCIMYLMLKFLSTSVCSIRVAENFPHIWLFTAYVQLISSTLYKHAYGPTPLVYLIITFTWSSFATSSMKHTVTVKTGTSLCKKLQWFTAKSTKPGEVYITVVIKKVMHFECTKMQIQAVQVIDHISLIHWGTLIQQVIPAMSSSSVEVCCQDNDDCYDDCSSSSTTKYQTGLCGSCELMLNSNRTLVYHIFFIFSWWNTIDNCSSKKYIIKLCTFHQSSNSIIKNIDSHKINTTLYHYNMYSV